MRQEWLQGAGRPRGQEPIHATVRRQEYLRVSCARREGPAKKLALRDNRDATIVQVGQCAKRKETR